MPNKMTVQGAINAALRLLNQYSITGAEVPLTYNDSADDVARMIDLINDCQFEIATVAKPIHEHTEIVVPKVAPGTPTEDIITDVGAIAAADGFEFNHSASILFTPLEGTDRRAFEPSEYTWIDRAVLAVPNKPAGTYRVEYERFPVRLNPDILNMTVQEREALMATPLDNTPDTHEAIPYFVAALIAVEQNKAAYQAFYNIFEVRLARLNMKQPYATRKRIDDVYGFGGLNGVW